MNSICFCIFVSFAIVLAGHILMFEYAEDHHLKKSFSKCALGEQYSEELDKNVTICSHCDDRQYQLASDRDAGDEHKCGEHATVGGVNLNDCCVRIHIEKRDMEFEAIFGCFIAIFIIIFAGLYVVTTSREADVYNDEDSRPLVPPPRLIRESHGQPWGTYSQRV